MGLGSKPLNLDGLYSNSDSMNMDKVSDTNKAPEETKEENATHVTYVFTWGFGGERVELIGSFNNWKERLPMKKNGNEFTFIMKLERGVVHQYKFIVDSEWRFAPDQQQT